MLLVQPLDRRATALPGRCRSRHPPPASELSAFCRRRGSPGPSAAADHGRDDRQRHVVECRRARGDGVAVVEGVRADPVLGDGRAQRFRGSTSSACRPPTRSRPASPADAARAIAARRNGSAPGGRRVGEEAGEPQARSPARSRPASSAASSGVATPVRPRPVSQSTRTPQLAPAPAAAPAEPGEQRLVVRGHRHRRPPRAAARAARASRPPTMLYGTRMSVDAGVGHHLRLAERLARDAARRRARSAAARSRPTCAS